MIKRLMFFSVMMSAVGVPYLISTSSDWAKSLVSSSPTSKDGDPTVQNSVSERSGTANPGANQIRIAGVLPEGPKTHDLAEVLQFDATPEWVLARWPRVTAGLAELDVQGYRVPLVTGTLSDDLAGSLTYYFDKNQRVARIDFHGATGDPRKLISLVTGRYNFKRQTTNDPSLDLYQVKWNGKPKSELRIRPARVVRADQPFARWEVELAMKRP